MTDIIYDKILLTDACSPFEFIDDKGKDETVVEEMKSTIAKLTEILNSTDNIIAISAPQIGVKKRLFCIKFSDTIKTFINPVIKRRSEEKFINLETAIDGSSQVYVCRPKEVEVTYFTEEFKIEDNKLLDGAAAIFMQQYNLLDGVVSGDMLEVENLDNIVVEDLPRLVEAAYSGSGLVLTRDEPIPELDEVAEVLSKLAAMFTAKLKDIADNCTDENLRKVARRFQFEESVILGRTKIIDQAGWEKEKQIKRQAALSAKKNKEAAFRQFAAKASK